MTKVVTHSILKKLTFEKCFYLVSHCATCFIARECEFEVVVSRFPRTNVFQFIADLKCNFLLNLP